MKKRILQTALCLAAGCSWFIGGRAQTKLQNVFNNLIYFDFVTTDTRMMVRQTSSFAASEADVDQVLNYMNTPFGGIENEKTPKSPLLLGVKLAPATVDYWGGDVRMASKEYTCYHISNDSPAVIVALGINKNNIDEFIYHVVENDSVELVPWSKIPGLEQKYGAKKPYGSIGSFLAPGRQLMVEVRSVKDYNIRDGFFFDWRKSYRPAISQINVAMPEIGTRIYYFNINYSKMNRGWATKFDEKTGLPLDMAFPADSVDEMLISLDRHETVPYSLYLIRKTAARTDTITLNYYMRDDVFHFDGRNYKEPGKYELIIQRTAELGHWQEEQLLRLHFEVQPPPVLEKKVSIKQTLPYLGATLGGVALLFIGFRRSSRIKLARSMQARQVIQLQLRSIRSQLNPHFMFNALTSIQNLMNKKDTEGANHYLARFADLTRTVLDTADQELISLEDELKILEDYLQMEKLRFGFDYQVTVDNKINIANTQVPAMLLQPFVENAVKHGIAGLHEKGGVSVSINEDEKDIVIRVMDNGNGFDKSRIAEQGAGHGIRLSEERIQLLNKVYGDQPSTLHIQSDERGTVITIRLSNWVA